MEHTQSATELRPVVIEPNGSGGADVWLNRNITTKEIPLEGDLSQTVWEAEQLHYVAPNVPDPEGIIADFEEVWAEHEPKPDVPATELADAIADLSTVVSDTADAEQVNADAIAELSELVSSIIGGE